MFLCKMISILCMLCATGLMFVADTGNHRVQVFDIETGQYHSTLMGDPAGGAASAGSDLTRRQLHKPQAIAIDAIERVVYIAEGGNQRVTAVSIAPESWGVICGTMGSTAVGGRHTGAYYSLRDTREDVKVGPDGGALVEHGRYERAFASSDAALSSLPQFTNPVDVKVDSDHGLVYVVDQVLHHVQMWAAFPRLKVQEPDPSPRPSEFTLSDDGTSRPTTAGTDGMESHAFSRPGTAPGGDGFSRPATAAGASAVEDMKF